MLDEAPLPRRDVSLWFISHEAICTSAHNSRVNTRPHRSSSVRVVSSSRYQKRHRSPLVAPALSSFFSCEPHQICKPCHRAPLSRSRT
ncbi:hypothetical protein DEO72_LG5g784 [Vigna unguiculata]|uniref:Uncharacterized protein n=1 Tax=Vigna unguiculata TaxID=3917 RepID=A0A4D6LVN8_VIGUN|nr:hypothetical protein DEO72_LG5g784 [Vigna unguiculata]